MSQSLQGGLPGWPSTMTAAEINEQTTEIWTNKLVGSVEVMDKSAVYDMVSHKILRKKLIHIGIQFKPVHLIMDYFTNRMQYTEINSNPSNTT